MAFFLTTGSVRTLCLCIKRGINVLLRIIDPSHSSALYPTSYIERCVLRNARDHLLDLINCSQHGFIPGKSCTTQLLAVHNYIGSLLDGGKQTDVMYMDMSKAFDKVNNETRLLNKLNSCFNISGNLLCSLTTYLFDCRQCVVLGATFSEKPVLSGVPQCSILGPT